MKKAYIMVIFSMLIYGTVGIFRSQATSLSSSGLAFVRGMLGFLFIFSFTLLRGYKKWEYTDGRTVGFMALSGICIGVNWLMLFEAFTLVGVSVGTLCNYFEPTIVILVSPIFFSEKLTAKKLICAVTAVVGMVFVSGVLESGDAAFHPLGIALGIGSAFMYAAAVILTKKGKGGDVYIRTEIQLLAAALVQIPYLVITKDFGTLPTAGREFWVILALGFFHTGVAYVLYFGNMTKLPSQTIAVLSYLDPILALVLSAIILKEHMTVLGIIGAVLVLGSTFVGEMNFGNRAKKSGEES